MSGPGQPRDLRQRKRKPDADPQANHESNEEETPSKSQKKPKKTNTTATPKPSRSVRPVYTPGSTSAALPTTTRSSDNAEEGEPDYPSVYDMKNEFLLGTALIDVEDFSPVWTKPKYPAQRSLDPAHVKSLENKFAYGINRALPADRLTVSMTKDDYSRMITASTDQYNKWKKAKSTTKAITEEKLRQLCTDVFFLNHASPSQYPILTVPYNTKIQLDAGQHRVAALKQFIRQDLLDDKPPHPDSPGRGWVVDIVCLDDIPDSYLQIIRQNIADNRKTDQEAQLFCNLESSLTMYESKYTGGLTLERNQFSGFWKWLEENDNNLFSSITNNKRWQTTLASGRWRDILRSYLTFSFVNTDVKAVTIATAMATRVDQFWIPQLENEMSKMKSYFGNVASLVTQSDLRLLHTIPADGNRRNWTRILFFPRENDVDSADELIPVLTKWFTAGLMEKYEIDQPVTTDEDMSEEDDFDDEMEYIRRPDFLALFSNEDYTKAYKTIQNHVNPQFPKPECCLSRFEKPALALQKVLPHLIHWVAPTFVHPTNIQLQKRDETSYTKFLVEQYSPVISTSSQITVASVVNCVTEIMTIFHNDTALTKQFLKNKFESPKGPLVGSAVDDYVCKMLSEPWPPIIAAVRRCLGTCNFKGVATKFTDRNQPLLSPMDPQIEMYVRSVLVNVFPTSHGTVSKHYPNLVRIMQERFEEVGLQEQLRCNLMIYSDLNELITSMQNKGLNPERDLLTNPLMTRTPKLVFFLGIAEGVPQIRHQLEKTIRKLCTGARVYNKGFPARDMPINYTLVSGILPSFNGRISADALTVSSTISHTISSSTIPDGENNPSKYDNSQFQFDPYIDPGSLKNFSNQSDFANEYIDGEEDGTVPSNPEDEGEI